MLCGKTLQTWLAALRKSFQCRLWHVYNLKFVRFGICVMQCIAREVKLLWISSFRVREQCARNESIPSGNFLILTKVYEVKFGRWLNARKSFLSDLLPRSSLNTQCRNSSDLSFGVCFSTWRTKSVWTGTKSITTITRVIFRNVLCG